SIRIQFVTLSKSSSSLNTTSISPQMSEASMIGAPVTELSIFGTQSSNNNSSSGQIISLNSNASVSFTVMTCSQILSFPAASVTVHTLTISPPSQSLKLNVSSKSMSAIPQLSVASTSP